MRLWHEKLIPYLDRQRLLSQHRECCALRGKGWGRKHSTVNYVFEHNPELLILYHQKVMDEMERRGYHPDKAWRNYEWRGNILQEDKIFAVFYQEVKQSFLNNEIIYPEHNFKYLKECIELLKEKEAPVNWEEVNKLLEE